MSLQRKILIYKKKKKDLLAGESKYYYYVFECDFLKENFFTLIIFLLNLYEYIFGVCEIICKFFLLLA